MQEEARHPNQFINFIAIILLSVAAAVGYGILHDQITVRVCLEYFTIGHPNLFGPQTPTMLAILWGTVASWWMGLFLGIILALSATIGSKPPQSASSLVRPLLVLLAIMAILAYCSGKIGFDQANAGEISLPSGLYSEIPKNKHSLFIADLFAHRASYAVGLFGGLMLAIATWSKRTSK